MTSFNGLVARTDFLVGVAVIPQFFRKGNVVEARKGSRFIRVAPPYHLYKKMDQRLSIKKQRKLSESSEHADAINAILSDRHSSKEEKILSINRHVGLPADIKAKVKLACIL